jgi:hypothetical protein
MNNRASTVFVSFLLVAFTPRLLAQASNNLPNLTVAYYDCNSAAAVTGSPSQAAILSMASFYIYQKVISDTSSPNLSFISYGFADSLTVGSVFAGKSFPLPDTGQPDEAHYIMTSKITGSSGNYVLTISVLDGRSYAHAVDKTVTFGSATDSDVKSACSSAVAQLLPLSTTILTYQQSLRSANPSLCINPQIAVLPSSPNVALKGKTKVSFTVIDCDGVPLAAMPLSLNAKHGSFSSETLITDKNGKAQADFTGGSKDVIDILSATMRNVATVTHDTINLAGAVPMIVGNPNTKNRVMVTFGYLYSKTSVKSKLLGDLWDQATSFGAYYSNGFMIGSVNSISIDCGGSDDNAWCRVGAFAHELEITRLSGGVCPKVTWHMNGKSYTLIATGGGSGSPYNGKLALQADNPYYGPIRSSISIEFPPDSVDIYNQFYWADASRSDGKDCVAGTTIDKYSSNNMSIFGPGKTTWFIGEPGFEFTPFYASGDSSRMVGFSATVSDVQITGTKDGSLVVNTTKFYANAMPITPVTSVPDKETALPIASSLSQNYPNPFNPSTIISYELPKAAVVSLRIFNTLGQEIASLVNERKEAGYYQVTWNANVPSGIYYYRLQAGEYMETKKMILLR